MMGALGDWRILALLSAVFAALTSILGKVGVAGVPSNLATAVRTSFVLVVAWGFVLARGEAPALSTLSRRTLLFLGLSAITTGLSWLAYFRALQLGPASRVAALDKLSLALTVVLAVVFLRETLTWRVGLGAAVMTAGAFLMVK
ncbi:MAG: EamA family transporter [Polyangiales bacterium]